ncbi:MAG: malectin domain-containing carbohydrate-binding protein, partial [Capsulimonadaceae bacterium]
WTTTVNTTLLTSPIPPIGVVQEDREGTFTYTITGRTANSVHSVTMYFVEQYFGAAGDRVFSVACNGTTVITNLDVYKTAGADYKAIQETFSGTATSSGQLVFSFTASVDQAKCSGIAVY